MMGRKAASIILNIIGTALLLSVIASCCCMVVPRTFGYEPYSVISGSMEPAMPVGSMAYVKGVRPESIQDGDVIAFFDDLGNMVVHRAVRNRIVEGEFVTKGDANDTNDMKPVPYSMVVGKVVLNVPCLGSLAWFYSGNSGKAYAICIAVSGAILNLAASRFRKPKEKPETED